MKLNNLALFKQQALVNGKWIESKNKIEVINPANEQKIGTIPNLGSLETKEAIAAAFDAFLKWKNLSANKRSELLRKWHDLILKNKEDLAIIMTCEQGKSISEARGEIEYSASFISWFSEEAKRTYGDTIPAPKYDQKIITFKEPVGVCALITPWNFPTAMIARKVAAALAAGCSAVIKPSELTPYSALALGELANEAGIPQGVINIVTGEAEPIGPELTSNPKVKKLSFTGSTKIGKLLTKECSNDLKRVSMELGGNAPFIVFDDANLEKAISSLIHCKFRNNGQTCISANRILVQKNIYPQFLEKLKSKITKLKIGNGLDEQTTQGPMISAKAVKKVEDLIADAISKGAQCEVGGNKISGPGFFFNPTILTNLNNEMKIWEEEIFGPVVAIYQFSTYEEAIKMANNTAYGLASYAFSQNITTILKLSQDLEYGMIGLNDSAISNATAPFGGIKHSGFGREGSHLGIDEYLQVKYLAVGF